jgi:hypothetical protein
MESKRQLVMIAQAYNLRMSQCCLKLAWKHCVCQSDKRRPEVLGSAGANQCQYAIILNVIRELWKECRICLYLREKECWTKAAEQQLHLQVTVKGLHGTERANRCKNTHQRLMWMIVVRALYHTSGGLGKCSQIVKLESCFVLTNLSQHLPHVMALPCLSLGPSNRYHSDIDRSWRAIVWRTVRFEVLQCQPTNCFETRERMKISTHSWTPYDTLSMSKKRIW